MPDQIPSGASTPNPEPLRKQRRSPGRLTHAVGILLVVAAGAIPILTRTLWQPAAARAAGASFVVPPATPRVAHDHRRDRPAKHKGGVDTSHGLYVREDEDVVLSHGQPFRLTRTYLSGYHVQRSFGVGTTSNAEWFLIGDLKDLSTLNLVLADGGRIRFDRLSGSSYDDSLWIHRSTPTRFNGAKLGWTGSDWGMRFPTGGFARFLACGPGSAVECLLTELCDDDGHALKFERDSMGMLLRIVGEDTHIGFRHDAGRRITQITSPEGQVDYSYDDRGRLIFVREFDGAERRYAYNDRDELLTVDEPGWFIRNTWDAQGRVIGQTTVVRSPSVYTSRPGSYTMHFDYTVVDGKVTRTDITESDGTHTLRSFNAIGYTIQEVDDAEGFSPLTTTYARHPVTMNVETVTVTCRRNGKPVSVSAPARGDEHATKWKLVADYCAAPRLPMRSDLFAAS
jgi:YD repeat-containing protein